MNDDVIVAFTALGDILTAEARRVCDQLTQAGAMIGAANPEWMTFVRSVQPQGLAHPSSRVGGKRQRVQDAIIETRRQTVEIEGIRVTVYESPKC